MRPRRSRHGWLVSERNTRGCTRCGSNGRTCLASAMNCSCSWEMLSRGMHGSAPRRPSLQMKILEWVYWVMLQLRTSIVCVGYYANKHILTVSSCKWLCKLSRCCGSVTEHWLLKPEVPWVRLLATSSLFTFFCLITSTVDREIFAVKIFLPVA